jgi:hypothetical protein
MIQFALIPLPDESLSRLLSGVFASLPPASPYRYPLVFLSPLQNDAPKAPIAGLHPDLHSFNCFVHALAIT